MPLVTGQEQTQPPHPWGFVERCFATLSSDPVYLFVPHSVITEQCERAAAQPFPERVLAPQSNTERLDACVANRLKYRPKDDDGSQADPEIVTQVCVDSLHIPWYEIPPWRTGATAGAWSLVGLAALAVVAAIAHPRRARQSQNAPARELRARSQQGPPPVARWLFATAALVVAVAVFWIALGTGGLLVILAAISDPVRLVPWLLLAYFSPSRVFAAVAGAVVSGAAWLLLLRLRVLPASGLDYALLVAVCVLGLAIPATLWGPFQRIRNRRRQAAGE
jgi:hypothetical protein